MTPKPETPSEGEPIEWFEFDEPLESLDGDDEGRSPFSIETAATFEEALEGLAEDSLNTVLITGFSDISRKQMHALRTAWKEVPVEGRRTVAYLAFTEGDENIGLDFMRFFMVVAEDEDSEVRQLAAEALALYDDPELIRLLLKLALEDSNDDVRVEALKALGSFAQVSDFDMLEPKDVKALRSGLMKVVKDESASVHTRSAALFSASIDSRTPGILKAIQSFAESGEPDLHVGAIRAMGSASSLDWLPFLERAIRSQDVDEREAAAMALSQYEDPSVVPMLTMAAREDQEPTVRLAAIRGLGEHGGEAALKSLETLAEYASDDEAEAILEAIQEVQEFLALDDTVADDMYAFGFDLPEED